LYFVDLVYSHFVAPEKITKTEGRKEITNKQRCEEMGEMR